MARSRRSAAVRTRPKSRGLPRADWVYRQNAINPSTGTDLDLVGTYDDGYLVQVSGVGNAQSHVLYDCHNNIGTTVYGGIVSPATVPRTINRAARAEGRKVTILATEGTILLQPDSWALGNVIAYGCRLGAFEQDTTGVFSLDPLYSMWVNGAAAPYEPIAMWANMRRLNAKEWRVWREFDSTSTAPLFPLRIFWKGKRKLDPKDCWGLYSEVAPTGIAVRQYFFLRTLVVDEG